MFDEDIEIWAMEVGFRCIDGWVRFKANIEICVMEVGFRCIGWVCAV